jgi:hypothetical protein
MIAGWLASSEWLTLLREQPGGLANHLAEAWLWVQRRAGESAGWWGGDERDAGWEIGQDARFGSVAVALGGVSQFVGQ